MARVVFLCGPAGSGKSYVARGLDLSFSSRRMRDDYRALLAPLGVVSGVSPG